MVSRSLEAAEILQQEGIHARVLEVHTIKPFDREAIEQAARETGALVTAEEHSITGGLGGAVAEAVGECYPVPVKRVGVRDQFTESGPYHLLLDRYGLAVQDVVAAAQEAVRMKRGS
jgi:transketolase